MSNGIACPKCGNNDQSQKVTSIVKRDTQSYRASGPSFGSAYVGGKWGLASGFTTVSGITQSELAKQLSPNIEMRKSTFITDAAALAMFAVVAFCIPVGIILAVAPSSNPMYTHQIPEYLTPVGITLILIGVLFGIWRFPELARRQRTTQSRKRADDLQRKEEYKKALSCYDRLFYCYRDDLVFDPKTGKSCPPSQMNTLLY